MKLKTKIQLFTSLFMIILVLLINTAIFFLFYKTSVDNETKHLKTQTNHIVETLADNPEIPKQDLLNAFLPENGMIRVYEKGKSRPILTRTRQAEYRHLPGQFYEEESSQVINNKGDPVTVVTYKPVIWENGEVVSLQVSTHLDSLQATMRTLFYVLVFASIFMVIPTVIAGNILSKFLVRPITSLIHTMQDNAKEAKWKKSKLKGRSKDELYEMEKTFNEMIDRLRDNYEKQEVFVSDASHELKTPISIVKSYAQLLRRRGQDNPEVFNESVQAIESEAERMQKLVEQMLLLAKNKQTATDEVVDLISLCKQVVETFQGVYERHIVVDILADSIFLKGNEGQLEQIIYILIDNALKYSEADVIIRLDKTNKNAILKVIDYGEGIPPADQARVFDRFYRMDKARNRETGGTGLGLAIAKTIAEQHDGNLSLMSEVGKGSTFTLEIPLINLN